jgi:hypothetical protein
MKSRSLIGSVSLLNHSAANCNRSSENKTGSDGVGVEERMGTVNSCLGGESGFVGHLKM